MDRVCGECGKPKEVTYRNVVQGKQAVCAECLMANHAGEALGDTFGNHIGEVPGNDSTEVHYVHDDEHAGGNA